MGLFDLGSKTPQGLKMQFQKMKGLKLTSFQSYHKGQSCQVSFTKEHF